MVLSVENSTLQRHSRKPSNTQNGHKPPIDDLLSQLTGKLFKLLKKYKLIMFIQYLFCFLTLCVSKKNFYMLNFA